MFLTLQAPGTMAYMPPEVLEEHPQCNATIDVFSFGHLALYTLVQSFPYPTAPTHTDPNNPGMIVGVTEVQRRSRQMEQLVRQLGGQGHPLVQLVTQCLHNDPRQRPSARQVLSQLERVRAQIQDPYAGLSKLELIQALCRRVGGGGGAAQDTGLQVVMTVECSLWRNSDINCIHRANLMQGKLSWWPVELRLSRFRCVTVT